MKNGIIKDYTVRIMTIKESIIPIKNNSNNDFSM